MTQIERIVIVGAGQAGGTAAGQLRHGGFTGQIVLLGDEVYPPYQRPPLSKAFLKGDTDAEALKLRADKYYHEHDVGLRLGATATGIDRATKQVHLDHGESLPYDVLIIATGSRPRHLPLPGVDLKGIHELRGIDDAIEIRASISPGKRIVMVGGGYIGLEVASTAILLGGSAMVIEREERILPRVASTDLSRFFDGAHRARGVEIMTGAQVAGFDGGTDGFVNAVLLSDGRKVACNSALMCVGGVPNDEIAKAAGITCDGGIVVDLDGRTSDPNIFALGDVTRRPMPLYDDRMFRLESVPNANEQAKQAVNAILGKPRPPGEVPWFWSDQFELKLQIAGVAFDPDATIVRGSPEANKFSIFQLKDGVIVCVEAVNAPGDFMVGRTLIGQRKPVSPERLADASIPMKEVAAG